ncbi:hypothetical protein TNCV_1293901 [Trichonephila clavipes]|nr:hypothetical protein TNCV_1293901 [Trichonephila clavipes]
MKVNIEPLRPKCGPPQCFRCQGFSIPADSALAHSDALSVQEITWLKIAAKPIDQKPSVVCAKESTLLAWVAPETLGTNQKRKIQLTKKATKPVKPPSPPCATQGQFLGAARTPHHSNSLTPAPPKAVPSHTFSSPFIRRVCRSTTFPDPTSNSPQ